MLSVIYAVMFLSLCRLMLREVMLSVVMLSVVILSVVALIFAHQEVFNNDQNFFNELVVIISTSWGARKLTRKEPKCCLSRIFQL